jgi:DNA repair exonuclease SbcCD ATPase subunit
VDELHIDLPFEIEVKRKELAELAEKIRTNEARAEKARIKAGAEGERAAKAIRNAEVYERRSQGAKSEVEALTGQIEGLEARLKQIEAAKTDAEEVRDRAREQAKDAEARAETAEARLQEVDQIIGDAAALAAEAAAAVITGDLRQGENGRWITGAGAPSAERLKPLWTHLRPALERVARWWDGIKGKVEALPEPDQKAFFDQVPTEGTEEGPGF